MKSDHSFDWKAFIFTVKLAALGVCIGTAGHMGWVYMQSPTAVHLSTALATTSEATLEPIAPVAAPVMTSTTSERIINSLTIQDVVPVTGKFIAADLVRMRIYLYQDGTATAEYPIKMKGRPGTPWETPSGIYTIQTKEKTHFSTIGKVYMPYSMQFYGNYFIHGMTYYPDGTPTAASFSGGCIKLSTADAEKVFAFATVGTKVFVYDSKQVSPPALLLGSIPTPPTDADAYLVADIDTGDVYAEQNAQQQRSVASATKLMTALVANEIISLDKKVSLPEGALSYPAMNTGKKEFLVGDLFYPLLMLPGDDAANALAAYYGKTGFVRWMNTTARALDMTSTTFVDASGASPDNVSTTEDLFRLARYLQTKKSFVLKISGSQTKTIVARDGSTYQIRATRSDQPEARSSVPEEPGTMLSILSLKVGEDTRHVAVIVLGSNSSVQDTGKLTTWITSAAKTETSQSACASCAERPHYRKVVF